MRLSTPIVSACLLAGMTAIDLPASPIFGLFSIAGNITVTATTIDWANTNSPFTPEQANVGENGTESFSSLDGTIVTIEDMNSSVEPVGSDFGPFPFITFDSAPVGFPTLLIDYIAPGVFSSADCAATPAVGQTCTVSPDSPFSFINLPGTVGVPPIQSTGTFNFDGVTSDGGTWEGTFSANFNTPYQTVLAGLSSSGSVTDTFSGTITVTSPLPEPQSAYMFGSGLALVLLSLGSRRLFRR